MAHLATLADYNPQATYVIIGLLVLLIVLQGLSLFQLYTKRRRLMEVYFTSVPRHVREVVAEQRPLRARTGKRRWKSVLHNHLFAVQRYGRMVAWTGPTSAWTGYDVDKRAQRLYCVQCHRNGAFVRFHVANQMTNAPRVETVLPKKLGISGYYICTRCRENYLRQ